jgi:hypothetical protein
LAGTSADREAEMGEGFLAESLPRRAVLTGANSRGGRRPRTSAKAAAGRVRRFLQRRKSEGVPANGA